MGNNHLIKTHAKEIDEPYKSILEAIGYDLDDEIDRRFFWNCLYKEYKEGYSTYPVFCQTYTLREFLHDVEYGKISKKRIDEFCRLINSGIAGRSSKTSFDESQYVDLAFYLQSWKERKK